MNPQDDERPATKGMLKDLATKDMLKDLATKDMLKSTNETVHKIAVICAQLRGEMSDFKHEFNDRLRAITIEQKGQLDAFLIKMETMWRESFSIPQRLDEHRKRLDDHENRIRAFES